jgi:nitronate monooxygenase
VDEAVFLEEQKIDMIAVQGIEAGGHRGTFFDHIPPPQIGLFSLLPQVCEAVKISCIATGGINNARTIRAAFDLGAVAVQVGSAFIGTAESTAIPAYKSRLTNAKDTDSALTRAFSGRWARGIRNEMMDEIEKSGLAIPPYPFQNSLTGKLRKLAQQNNDPDYTNLWAGQSAGPIGSKAEDVLMDLVRDYETKFRAI